MPRSTKKARTSNSLRHNLAPERDEDANLDGKQAPRRQVHLRSPRRKSHGFDRRGTIKIPSRSRTQRWQLRLQSTQCYVWHRSTKSRQRGDSHTSKGISDRFLDFAFIFNAGITFRRLFDNIDQKCTPEKFSHRIIFLSMKEEWEVDQKLHKIDDLHTQNAQELGRKLRPTRTRFHHDAFRKQNVDACTGGPSTNQKSTAFLSHSRSSSQAVRESSAILVAQRTKKPQKNKNSYLAASIKTKVDKFVGCGCLLG